MASIAVPAARRVVDFIGHHVPEELAEQRLFGAAEHVAEGSEGERLDDDLHAEVGDVPARILEQRHDLGVEERVHRIGVAELLVEVLGEHLGVAGLVHRLGGGVVLGVDPRDGLGDLGGRQHGALLAVHELAERGLEELDPDLGELLLAPRGDRRAGDLGGGFDEQLGRARVGGDQLLRVDVDRPVELGDAVPLGRHRLVVELDELFTVTRVVPRHDPLGVVGDQTDRLVHLPTTRQVRHSLGHPHGEILEAVLGCRRTRKALGQLTSLQASGARRTRRYVVTCAASMSSHRFAHASHSEVPVALAMVTWPSYRSASAVQIGSTRKSRPSRPRTWFSR